MEDKELITKLRQIKDQRRYTLYDLSKIIDVQVATIGRWFATGRINRLYAEKVKKKLEL